MHWCQRVSSCACIQYLHRPEEGDVISGAAVIGDCKPRAQNQTLIQSVQQAILTAEKFLQALHLIRDRVSHWIWSSLIRPGWLAGEPQAPSGFCLPSAGIASAGHRAEHYEYLGPGAQTQALTLARQALHRLSHFPSLCFWVLLLNLLVAGSLSSQADK